MTPLDEALASLTEVHRGWCNYCRGDEKVCMNAPRCGCSLRDYLALLAQHESAAAQEQRVARAEQHSATVKTNSAPASAAPSTSTAKYPPDFPATVTKDLMQHSVAAPTPLTDALSRGHYQSVPIEVAYGEMFEHARDLERKLVEAQRDAEKQTTKGWLPLPSAAPKGRWQTAIYWCDYWWVKKSHAEQAIEDAFESAALLTQYAPSNRPPPSTKR